MTGGGVMTQQWGWQPTARLENGLPTWRWRNAPPGLVTRRQMRALGLAPGGAQPVAQIVCRRGRRRAWLYDPADLVPKRVPTPAQLVAVAAALAARRWCPTCLRDVGYCIPTSLGECVTCHFPDPPADGVAALRPATPRRAPVGARLTCPRTSAPTSGAITMATRTARTAVGPCRHCRQPLEHRILRDEDDQPVNWYLGRDARGVLDGTCYGPGAPERDCDMCRGTGDELGDPDAEWACDSCDGGRTTDHQPDLPAAIERALADYRGSQGDHDSPTRWALDAIQQTTSHAQVERWLADGTVDAETAAAYHAVLIASHDDLAAAESAGQPVVLSIAPTSGGEPR